MSSRYSLLTLLGLSTAMLSACGGATSTATPAPDAPAPGVQGPGGPTAAVPPSAAPAPAAGAACGSTASTLLASGEGVPSAIEADETRVYWLTHAGAGADGGVKLRTVAKCGGPVTTLATGPYFAEGLTQDATTLFFATSTGSGQGAIVSVPKAGGAATILRQGTFRPAGVAVDDTSLYWADPFEHAVYKLPKSGGAPVLVASGLAPKGLTSPTSVGVNGSHVFAAGAEGVWKIPVAGGTPELRLEQSTLALRAAGDDFVVASGSGIFALYSAEGTTKRLSAGGNGLCASGRHIAFVSGEIVAVHRVPLLGGVDEIVVESGAKGPGAIACDATAAYWAGGGQITRSSLLP